MTLEALKQAGELGELVCGAGEIAGLLAKADRKLNDARAEAISVETRLEQAYTVIMTCATIALRAMNLRVLTSSARHYMTIETLRYTLGLENDRVEYYHSLRNLRHQDIYAASIALNQSDLNEAINEAERLLKTVRQWLSVSYPDLVR